MEKFQNGPEVNLEVAGRLELVLLKTNKNKYNSLLPYKRTIWNSSQYTYLYSHNSSQVLE